MGSVLAVVQPMMVMCSGEMEACWQYNHHRDAGANRLATKRNGTVHHNSGFRFVTTYLLPTQHKDPQHPSMQCITHPFCHLSHHVPFLREWQGTSTTPSQKKLVDLCNLEVTVLCHCCCCLTTCTLPLQDILHHLLFDGIR